MSKPTCEERSEIEYIAYRQGKTVAEAEEEARKIVRYDRAMELLRESHNAIEPYFSPALSNQLAAFLAEEPK